MKYRAATRDIFFAETGDIYIPSLAIAADFPQSMPMEPIHLLVTLDSSYVMQLKVLLTSIRINNPGERFTLHLIHNDIAEDEIDRLGSWLGEAGWSLQESTIDASLFDSAPSTRQYPKEMYYRLLAPHILMDEERVLYLDPDILVINPLRPLWDMDMQGFMLAAASHTGITELANGVNRIRLGTEHDYYNSGVLLMDLQAGRETIVPDEIFRYVREHEKELLLPDQDILNALYGSRILSIDDAIWNYDARNYTSYMIRSSGLSNEEWIMRNTAILHFCGKAKPWKKSYIYRFGMLYRHYMQLARRMWQTGMLTGLPR